MPAPPPDDWVLTHRREIGVRIRAARLHAGLTQERVALMTGIDRPSIVRIEAGQQNATINSLIRIADAIGVPLRDLV